MMVMLETLIFGKSGFAPMVAGEVLSNFVWKGLGYSDPFSAIMEQQTFSSVTSENPIGRNISVLLVDDDRINQLVGSKFLNKWGYNVVVANGGKEALDLIASKKFHVILMDYNMPEMDGSEATRRIRAMEDTYFKTVPILLFSATVESKEKAVALGMTDFVTKPLDPVDLQNKIIKYVSMINEMITTKSNTRKLSVNFELYTEGDIEFKHQLILLMINNLEELERAVTDAESKNDMHSFNQTLHKVKPTLEMVNDWELVEVLNVLKAGKAALNGSYQQKKSQFNHLTREIIRSLELEISTDNHGRRANAA